MSVIVYTKAGFCGQCKATETALDRAGIAYEPRLLEDQPAEVIEDFKATIGLTAPIVITDTAAGSWAGFRPDLIGTLAAA